MAAKLKKADRINEKKFRIGKKLGEYELLAVRCVPMCAYVWCVCVCSFARSLRHTHWYQLLATKDAVACLCPGAR
jgi:hypothetical protein